MSSEADRARAADQVSRAEMAESVQKQLAQNLELMTKEQRKQFQQRLPDLDLRQHSPGATTSQPEKLDGLEMASRLVAQYGEKKARDLALQTWKQMGLRELCAQVPDKEALESGTKVKFQKQQKESSCSPQSWKNEDFQAKFIQPLLLQTPQPRGYDVPQWMREHKVKESQKYLTEVGDLFGPGLGSQKETPTVVLHGVAGIGKSTMARQVRRAWAEGQQFRDHFQHVFYFHCRELAQLKTKSLNELLTTASAGPMAPIGQILSHPEQLLFILDNLDEAKFLDLEEHRSELPQHWRQPQEVYTLLGSLLKKSFLPEASLLITARITALEKLIPSLQQPRWIEVLGFSESARREYFHKYFTHQNQATRAFSLVESNPALLAMCLMPLVSWLVCTCLKQQMDQGQELSLKCQTITDLCLHYFFHVLQAQSLGTNLRGFCSMAAEATRKGKTLFTSEDLREHGLDEHIFTLLKKGFLQEDPTSQSYSFIHLCFQEFFAAMSCALGDEKLTRIISIKNLTEFNRNDVFGKPTICFLFGLFSKLGMRRMESIFKCKLSGDMHCRLLQLAKTEVHLSHACRRSYCWHLLHCFYEIQDISFLRKAMPRYSVMRIYIQTYMELLMFTFCIKFSHCMKRLQLNEGGPHGQAQEPSGVVLLSLNLFSCAGWKMFFSILQAPGSLKELDLSGNFLSSFVIKSLSKALKSHCHLEALRLADCSLTAEGCQDLARGLKAIKSLTKLDLSFNSIQDNGAQYIFQALKKSGYRLQHVLLVKCGLTSGCCKDLVSMLSANPSLTELDLQQNNLGDLGMKVLCEGLRLPTCQLRLLRLDQTQQSEEVKEMLRVLHLEKPELLLDSGKTSSSGGRQMDVGISPLKWQEPEPETKDVFWGPTGSLATEVVDKERSLYRVHFPVAGYYEWPNTSLQFVVRRPVTVEIKFCAWKEYLNQIVPQHSWMFAGPLFDIQAEPGAIKAVYLPHFVDLQGKNVDKSWLQVAHIKEEGMVLEKPARVEPHYAVLKNPSFSPLGVLLRIIQAALSIPINSNVLLYHQINDEGVTFHLYLIPNDCSIRKAIDEEEKKFQFVQIHKPPPLTSLYMGSRYTVSGPQDMIIIPQEDSMSEMAASDVFAVTLRSHCEHQSSSCTSGTGFCPFSVFPFYQRQIRSGHWTFICDIPVFITTQIILLRELELCYRSPGEAQLFCELCSGHLRSSIMLYLRDKKDGTVVWHTMVKSGDLRPEATLLRQRVMDSHSSPDAPALLHFVDQHREQLVARVTSVDQVMDKLYGRVLNDEQYQSVRAESTNPNKMRMLFSYSISWDKDCKDQLYQALKETDPHLIMDIWEKWRFGGD